MKQFLVTVICLLFLSGCSAGNHEICRSADIIPQNPVEISEWYGIQPYPCPMSQPIRGAIIEEIVF